jgi:RNA polymerase sigma factor (TIGR02999 family)
MCRVRTFERQQVRFDLERSLIALRAVHVQGFADDVADGRGYRSARVRAIFKAGENRFGDGACVYTRKPPAPGGHLVQDRTERKQIASFIDGFAAHLFRWLVGLNRMALENRTHFFAMAARLMREILVDHARRKNAIKRGGGITVVGLEDVAARGKDAIVDVLALDEALTDLGALDQRLSRAVELRFFAGLSIADTAEALSVSSATVERDWAEAKAWLQKQLSRRVA